MNRTVAELETKITHLRKLRATTLSIIDDLEKTVQKAQAELANEKEELKIVNKYILRTEDKLREASQ